MKWVVEAAGGMRLVLGHVLVQMREGEGLPQACVHG